MFEAQLFLGIKINESLSTHLAKANPNLLALLIQDESIYLQKISHQENDYIGKYVGNLVSLAQLELIELNILSLLKKICPDCPTQGFSVILFSSLNNYSLLDS
jgi:hypothetical protein